jgi:hypothetical protein
VEGNDYVIGLNFDVYEEMEVMDLRVLLLELLHYVRNVEGRPPFVKS